MKASIRIASLVCCLALVSGTARADHSEIDTYYGTTAGTNVVHIASGCAGPEHAGGACFTGFDEELNVTITMDDAVVAQTGAVIIFRPATGSDLKRIPTCINDGVPLGPFEIPADTNRIVVFLGTVVDTVSAAPVCPGAPQPTTGTVTAEYAA